MSFFNIFEERYFCGVKSIFFYPEHQKIFLSGFFLLQKKIGEKGRFLDKNHGLTPLQNVDCFRLFRSLLLRSKKYFFST